MRTITKTDSDIFQTFLAGLNIAWVCHGCDFGNNNFNSTVEDRYKNWIRQVFWNSGNSIRE